MNLLPNTLQEFNPCHNPADGKFAGKNLGRCEAATDANNDGQIDLDERADLVRREATTDEERTYAREIAQAELDNIAALSAYGERGTKTKYYDAATGDYSAERKAVHDKVINTVLTHQLVDGKWVPRTTPLAAQENPAVIFMVGMSAAGKTTAAQGLNYDNKLLINSDDLKSLLPEWNGANAAVLHEESADLADRLFEIGRLNRYSMVLDSTLKSLGGVDYTPGGDTAAGARARIERLKRDNYRVEARYTDVDINDSITRSVKRFIGQKAKTGVGRYVPIGFIRANADASFGTLPRRSFEAVKGYLDAYTFVDNRGKVGVVKYSHGKLTEADKLLRGGTTSAKLTALYQRAEQAPTPQEEKATLAYAQRFAPKKGLLQPN